MVSPKFTNQGPLSGLSCPLSTLPHMPCQSIWSISSPPWSADPIHMSGMHLTLHLSLQVRPWNTTWWWYIFDVVSLFTKVPVHLATKVAQDRMSGDTSLAERTSLSADEVVNLLRFCLDATNLAYNGDVFQQIFCTAMGSPVSVTVMEDVEERALGTCPHPHPFWKRYMDHTTRHIHSSTRRPSRSVPGPSQHGWTHNQVHHGGVKWVTLFRGHPPRGWVPVHISVHKVNHTGCYLDFTSHHHLAYKVAVARTLKTQADRICTFVPDRDKEKQHIFKALNNNGYHSQHVNENWWPRSSPRPSSSEDPPKILCLLDYYFFCMYFIFMLFTAITTFHMLSFFPPNWVYLTVPIFFVTSCYWWWP